MGLDFDEYQSRTDDTNIYEDAIDELLRPIEKALFTPDKNSNTKEIDWPAHDALARVRQILNWYYVILGLVGEAGELANKAKKITRDKYPKITDKHDAEISDVLWYIAQIAIQRNKNLSEYAEENLEKLAGRKRRGKIGGDGDER